MFDLKSFVKSNLISGFQNGSFTIEQVNIYAANYLLKAVFNESDVEEISTAITPVEENGGV